MEEEYLKNRLQEQIAWYDKKSQANQKYFKRLRLLEIIAAAFIPFWAGVGINVPYYSVIIAGLGVIIAISAGGSALYKFHENWIEYRTTAETLKHEKFLYISNCSPYDQDNAFCKLVQRVEGLISKENSQWARYAEKLQSTQPK